MKKFVRLIVPLVLLLVAVPSYAICGFCHSNCECRLEPGANRNCAYQSGGCCYETARVCFSDAVDTFTPLATQYTIASVEVIAIDAVDPHAVRIAEQKQPAPAEIASIHP